MSIAQRLPPDASSQFVYKSRSRAGLPHNSCTHRALAWDFLAICSDDTPSALRNHAIASIFLTICLGFTLSLETSSRSH
eukprot:9314760-Pyramimonas_sp.AAC.1